MFRTVFHERNAPQAHTNRLKKRDDAGAIL